MSYSNPRIRELQEHREGVIDFIQSRPAGVDLEPLQENLTELEQEIDCLIELEEGNIPFAPDSITAGERRAIRRELINDQLREGRKNLDEIIGAVEDDEYERFGYSMRVYAK